MSVRVLVAFEDLRSLYRELLVRAILDSRPTLNVRSASLEELAHVLLDFDPHVVVCSEPNGAHPPGSSAWVQIPTDNPSEDSAGLAQLCLDGEHWLSEGPRLSELFAVIDEAKERLRGGPHLGAPGVRTTRSHGQTRRPPPFAALKGTHIMARSTRVRGRRILRSSYTRSCIEPTLRAARMA